MTGVYQLGTSSTNVPGIVSLRKIATNTLTLLTYVFSLLIFCSARFL